LKLGRYEIIRELGKGAMGVVYLAKDPLIGRLVALKTIRVGSQVDEEEVHEFQERFVREAQAAGILSHPSIVTVHDIGRDDSSGNSFIAMEYVEGRTLKEILNQGRPFSPTDAAEVLSQIGDALAFAHRKGIVHRDVKPANIIICEENHSKITDFGIAKIASSVANLTMTGQFLGTPNYMSPEQVKGLPVDGRSDIFSLGIVLYESLTRQKPFGGDSLTTISYRIVHDSYTPASRTDPRIPMAFDTVIGRCLEKLPADRYETAGQLASDLRAILDGTLVEAPPVVVTSNVDMGEGTVVDPKGHVSTIEIPFPEAAAFAGEGDEVDTAPKTATPREEPAQADTSRFGSWSKRTVPLAHAAGIVGGLLLALLITMSAIWAQRVEVPPVDTAREALVAKQRELRIEGRRLLEQGNVEGAYEKYFELRGLAPDSPAVGSTLRNLETIRSMRMSYAQRQAEARQNFEEGRSLYDQRRYAQAIPFFEQAFHLDDSLASAVSYLQMSREQMNLAQMRQRSAPAAAEPPRAIEATPAMQQEENVLHQQEQVTLLTIFNSPVTDGYMVVTVDGEAVIHEDLFEVKWGFLGRRSPRQISAYRSVSAGPSEIDVWMVVPSLNMQERRTLTPVLEPGKLHRLTVTLNPSRKTLDLQLR
jgi:serine/threonine protein kinase